MEKYRYEEIEQRTIESSCIPYAVYQYVDKKVLTIALSEGFMELFGFTDRKEAMDLMDNNMYRDTNPEDVARIVEAAVRFATEEEKYDVTYRSLIDGAYHVIRSRGRHVFTKTGERLAYVWYSDEGLYDPDNSADFIKLLSMESEKNNRNLKGDYDPLTGLPGMNYFFEAAEAGRDRYKAQGLSSVALFFDFNGMENYNLRYGFAEGDKLIIGMARVLVDYFSTENCCRLGGDRFAVFFKEEGLEETLEALFEDCKKINNGNSLPVRVGIYQDSMADVRIGVACDRAKMACDINKGNTESSYAFFNEELLKVAERRQYIINNLGRAINEKWLQVYYQPIVRAANGFVCDEEALARWIDPNIGFLSPADFIPVLEETGLIYKLDLYVADEIIAKMKRQAEEGLYTVPCSINISRSDFETCDVVEEIRKRVDDAGFSHEMLTIEITESIVGSDVSYIKRQVERFHEFGFKVWMDDYGSGYSSPDILLTIPFDTIKLDMLFIRQFETNVNSRLIISGLVKMALSLGIDTVVEGVETLEQAEFLKEIGCTKLQGYHFSKPIPAEEIFKRYREGKGRGFENPDETDYYSAIGRVNLYDLSGSLSLEEGIGDYFDTMPMSIVELDTVKMTIIRTNQSYRTLIENHFEIPNTNTENRIAELLKSPAAPMMRALLQCAAEGKQILDDEHSGDGKILHILMRRISRNPVTGAAAVLVVVLGIKDESMGSSMSFSYIAQALSADYIDMYYVDLMDDDFVEYLPKIEGGEVTPERKGRRFFAEARERAAKEIYAEDRDKFIGSFTKENIIDAIDEHGAFTISYRLTNDGNPMYVNMKAIYIGTDKKHIMIGVNSIDAQMHQQEALERIKEESLAYSRISALFGEYVCFFTVDTETGKYLEFSGNADYDSFELAREGDDFFAACIRDAKKIVHPDDVAMFEENFSKKIVLDSVEKIGKYEIEYRLMINSVPVRVCYRAVMVNEEGGRKLIVGVRKV